MRDSTNGASNARPSTSAAADDEEQVHCPRRVEAPPALDGPDRIAHVLNSLISLDHDALAAYDRVATLLSAAFLREHAATFRHDHERRVDELSRLVRAQGGVPLSVPQLPQGSFQLAIDSLAPDASDRQIVIVIKCCERAARDAYRAALEYEGYPAEVSAVLRRGANDAAVHYAWALETLDDLATGTPPSATLFGRISEAFEAGNLRVSGAFSGFGDQAAVVAERARRGAESGLAQRPLQLAAIALGVGVAAGVLRRRGSPPS